MNLSDCEKEKVRDEAKRVMNSFAKSLDKLKFKEIKEDNKEEGCRTEGDGNKNDVEFRHRIFENAPSKGGDFIIAESKQW